MTVIAAGIRNPALLLEIKRAPREQPLNWPFLMAKFRVSEISVPHISMLDIQLVYSIYRWIFSENRLNEASLSDERIELGRWKFGGKIGTIFFSLAKHKFSRINQVIK